MRSPTIRPNRSFAWTRNRCRCTPTCAPIAAKPGKPAKQDNEYERCGTANVFAVVEPKSGRHFTTATPDRCAAEFARHNLNIHCRQSLIGYYGEAEAGNQDL